MKISNIAKVYGDLIKKGDKTGKTIDDVPEKLRDEVIAYLNENSED